MLLRPQVSKIISEAALNLPRRVHSLWQEIIFTKKILNMQIVVSSAFFVFHERPTAIQLLPSAGFATATTQIVVRVSGLFSMFRGCTALSSRAPDDYLPIGADPNVTCLANASITPSPELYCLIGQIRVDASISSPALSSDPVLKTSDLYCAAPQLSADRNRDGSTATAVVVRVGMNPYTSEFSYPLRFILQSVMSQRIYSKLELCRFLYASVVVSSIYPAWGLAIVSGDVLNVVGCVNFSYCLTKCQTANTIWISSIGLFYVLENDCYWLLYILPLSCRIGFVNTTELSCFFRPLAFRGSSAIILARPALYLSPTAIQCLIPAAEEFPLPCTCVCDPSSSGSTCQANLRLKYGGTGPTRSNTTKFDPNGIPIVSSQSVAAAMCACCPGTGKGNCSVSVGVGVNLQLSTYGGDESIFLYSLDSPVVCCPCSVRALLFES